MDVGDKVSCKWGVGLIVGFERFNEWDFERIKVEIQQPAEGFEESVEFCNPSYWMTRDLKKYN